MIHRRKILILTSKTGGGHVSLAEALCDRLQQDYSVSIEDLLPGFFPRHYRFVAQQARWLWSCEYHISDNPRIALLGHHAMIPLITPLLEPLLERLRPDLVLSVHPLLTHAVKHVLDRRAHHIPFVMLFSDPMRIHCAWLTEHTAASVFAPTYEVYTQALENGFAPSRLHFVGWPVRRQFASVSERPREQLIEELQRSQHWNLDPARLTIFASSGAEGAPDVEEAVQLVLAQSQEVQAILATGNNWALYHRCRGVKNLYAFPFTSEVVKYMAVAHIAMGRCSPNILFEALALGKPFIATSYMTGQEEGNARFIEQHALGWAAFEAVQLRQLLTALVSEFPSDRSLLNAMAAKAQAYQQMNAAANEFIVPCIRALLDSIHQPGEDVI
jgi:UDP-N-acetylglucosamine:LPS N-acetylglucosamine transferase